MKLRISLIDGSFPHIAASNLGGDCAGEEPQLVSWDRELMSPGPVVITDMGIPHIDTFEAFGNRIGWLLEPPSLSDSHYRGAILYRNKFDIIFTFDVGLIATYPDKFKFYPFGGSWIAEKDWKVYDKIKSVSIIASQKKGAEGHRMRHAIIDRFPKYAVNMGVDVMGYGYCPIQSKLEGLADYRYSIIVESCRWDDYFSEKLIDCLACGTVPLYWGCHNIGKYFNKNGIIAFDTISDLEHRLIQVVSEQDYKVRMDAIKENMERAREYRCAEDNLVKCYPEVFDSCIRVV